MFTAPISAHVRIDLDGADGESRLSEPSQIAAPRAGPPDPQKTPASFSSSTRTAGASSGDEFFAPATARLTDAGRLELDALAVALNDPALAQERFMIVGVAGLGDPMGGLAHSRAEAVRDHLVISGAVSPDRLKVRHSLSGEEVTAGEKPNVRFGRWIEFVRLGD